MTKFPIRLSEKPYRKGNLFATIAIVIFSAIFILMVFFNLTYTRIYVVGSSMKSTLTGAIATDRPGGDYVYICKYLQPRRGDIVVIDVGDRSLIKRVIALGGESVRLEDGVLYLKDKNGEEEYMVEEPYVDAANNQNKFKNTFDEVVVPEGYVFCMGDNRDNSEDSRGVYGCMSVNSIVGVVTGWSIQCKSMITNWNTFFEFTLPELFGS